MRVALTGGATGIGASVAAKLKKRGAHVTAFDLNEPIENVDQWIKTDLGDPESIVRAAEQTEGLFDALINNAGLPPRKGLTETVLRVNFLGLRQFTQVMLEKLAKGSAIVNTASRAGAMWRENIKEVKALMALRSCDELPAFIAANKIDYVRAYHLSKEAVIAQTFVDTEMLIERDIRINCVSPAAVSTGILGDFKNAFGDRVDKAIASVGRAGTPDEIAEVIVFLASPQSQWIKGQDITIDGGMTALGVCDAFGLSRSKR